MIKVDSVAKLILLEERRYDNDTCMSLFIQDYRQISVHLSFMRPIKYDGLHVYLFMHNSYLCDY